MLTDDRFALANGITARQQVLDIDALGNTQGIFQLNAQVTHRAIDLRVPKQKLHGAKVAKVACKFEPRPDCSDLLESSGRFCPMIRRLF